MKHKGKRKRIYRKKLQTVAQHDSDFPGYPHYSAQEDVMANAKREKIDIEKFPERVQVKTEPKQTDNFGRDKDIVSGTAADVKAEDLEALGSNDFDMGIRDDELLVRGDERFDRTGEDLDIPGAELDDENEIIGEEDEENNYYSLGGDKEDNSS